MLSLAILWHQHQPFYKDTSRESPWGSYVQPWVRLHAIRDYYSMAAIVGEHPGIHLTINLTPALLWQLDDYIEGGATDDTLELTLQYPAVMSGQERERLLATFFDADWHNQIFPHPRYKELFLRRQLGQRFDDQDVRDLQMWFNLAWFAREFREGEVRLPTGEVASVRRFVERGRDFREADVEAMVAEQYKILRAVVPMHRQLQERGQIEVSTTPFSHPILPLLLDTDRATIDRPGATHPRRFAHPEDADAQVRLAIDLYERHFAKRPRGMWPAEGAVARFAIPFFARSGARWIATDQGVLARSGRWGYRTDDPDVLCRPYRAEEAGDTVSVFFRDTALSDAIGFRYSSYPDPDQAARDFVSETKERFLRRAAPDGDRVLTVALDGENAWGSYRDDARPFLHALYGLLERDGEIQTVTFSEYLDGNASRGVAPHPAEAQTGVFDLFTGSWIDEIGSAPGVDLGTWIGEFEENRAWELLGDTRDFLDRTDQTPEAAPAAFLALYMAEGSDWFWWFGDDQESGRDEEFDGLFRIHLSNVYRRLGAVPPAELDRHIVPHVAVWTFAQPIAQIQPGERLRVLTNCPGVLHWSVDGGETRSEALVPVGGVMAGTHRSQVTLCPVSPGSRALSFRFQCTHPGCDCKDECCSPRERAVTIAEVPATIPVAPSGL
jgi:alpha-amylase/alpha-mannosidase (GH57 family)